MEQQCCRGDGPHRDRARGLQQEPGAEDRGEADELAAVDPAEQPVGHSHALDLLPDRGLCALSHPLQRRLLLVERGECLDTPDRIEYGLTARGFAHPHFAEHDARPAEERPGAEHVERCGGESGEGEPGIERGQCDHRHGDRECGGQQGRGHVPSGLGHRIDIAGHAGEQVGALAVVDRAHRKTHRRGEHVLAQCREHVLHQTGEHPHGPQHHHGRTDGAQSRSDDPAGDAREACV